MTCLTLASFVLVINPLCGQNKKKKKKDNRNQIIEQRIELLAENLEAEDLDYTTLFDELSSYLDHPVNLNRTDRDELAQLYLLNDFQIQNLMDHIAKTGKLVSIYELQGIRGFDVQTIRAIQPFVTTGAEYDQSALNFDQIKKEGQHTLFLRFIRVLEESEGFSPIADSVLEENPNRRYLGNPDRYYLRYRFQYTRRISIGFTAEKDPGEEFFNGSQRNGFDFYSGHVYFRDLGRIKHLALGDYQVQFGQGLTYWSGLGFGKSSEVLNIKRSAPLIKPYTSVDENLFLRGGAATIGFGKYWSLTGFYSNKLIDANRVSDIDTVDDQQPLVVSSLLTSGFHRTPGELDDKDVIREITTGGHLQFQHRKITIGATATHTDLGGDLQRNLQPYNQFTFNSSQLTNAGIDYQYIFRNLNFFGEYSYSDNGGFAMVNGVLASLDPRLSLSVFHRRMERDYQFTRVNPISESSNPGNESGTYFGIRFIPTRRVTVSAYYDRFRFPWLRFRTDAPSRGYDYLVQVNYKISKRLEMYLRHRQEVKDRNGTTTDVFIAATEKEDRQYTRFNLSYKVSDAVTIKSRAEFSQFKLGSEPLETGVLLYQDLFYKPKSRPYSFNVRYALFDMESFDARIYAYESDILYAFAVPAYANRGARYYFNVKYRFRRGIDLWLKFSQTYLNDRDTIGSGLNEIDGNTRTEVRAQLRLKF